MIKLAKSLGFRVVTNTTIYKETNLEETEQLFAELAGIGVDGFPRDPRLRVHDIDKGAHSSWRSSRATRSSAHSEMSKRYRILSTPMYLRFLKGERDLKCSPWGGRTTIPRMEGALLPDARTLTTGLRRADEPDRLGEVSRTSATPRCTNA